MARVLVVDDEPDVRALVRVNLEADGHEVVCACDGSEALRSVADRRPDVVVLDMMMPGVDGWAVLAGLKRRGSGADDVPVIVLTARDEAEARIRSGIEGAIRYLVKPFDPHALRAEVRSALEGDPEPLRRRRVQQASLEELALLEKGSGSRPSSGTDARPHLTRLERSPAAPAASPQARAAREALDQLSDKQRELLQVLSTAVSVSDAAQHLSVSRSNIYASLRRINRKLGIRSVPELLNLLRHGDLLGPEPPR
jgi:DNA-binding response OmpR family regulator